MANDLSNGFDPHTLAETVRRQAPEFSWLPGALSNCGRGEWESRAYVRYVPRRDAAGAPWPFQASLVLNHAELGTVVLDILAGERLGGIEFVDRLP